ncbi:FAD-dependent oxidoreductase [Micromonospora sp. NPDC050686]|uniref:FAD-dependent oxidoreductase n=1 Tax=Micromonospora sp. NPDC050686 TaxID=3154631 RepID=UPI0033DF8481
MGLTSSVGVTGNRKLQARQHPVQPFQPHDHDSVVHSYGHAGNGVMLSWGCARDAAALALGGQTGGSDRSDE